MIAVETTEGFGAGEVYMIIWQIIPEFSFYVDDRRFL